LTGKIVSLLFVSSGMLDPILNSTQLNVCVVNGWSQPTAGRHMCRPRPAPTQEPCVSIVWRQTARLLIVGSERSTVIDWYGITLPAPCYCRQPALCNISLSVVALGLTSPLFTAVYWLCRSGRRTVLFTA